ncbi:ABC transporter ATP-binding protein [Exilibacterium tricleocarpae]|uniref:ABC transporter ATP-binding protein n=1 Tax=Exilibacterium tricleocarpae TaxID=2591008 RepID=A0A545TQL1_9GAMM|nr:ABC transporter ATP-binding protein [Exilibacterium tricleocarpae]TQV79515.1 ABC transporter ATP-binding protein [Exilibacterium tricleocarpae]
MSAILQVRSLTKHFKDVQAVNGLSFAIEPGTCFGLLGPNGAGKTTTIEMIEGITEPNSGEILYKGKPRDGSFKLETGIQFQSTALMDYLTVTEVLDLFSHLYPRVLPRQQLADLCHLGDFLDQPAAKLSGGQRQRVLLALALINDPQLVFLDEPTTGLDPQSRRAFWQLIEDIKSAGKTVVLTTHYMDEAEQLCDRLAIIDHGRIIAEGSPQQLLQQHFDYVFVCIDRQDFPAHLDPATLAPSDAPAGAGATPPGVVAVNGSQVAIKSHAVEETLEQLIQQRVKLNSLRVRNPTLDDLFLKLTGHSLRE